MANKGRFKILGKFVKIVLWTIMAIVLLVAATVICITNVLSPEHLTAIANRVANQMLDAEVKIGRVELGLKRNLPLLTLQVDDVTVLSKPMMRSEDRTNYPAWADSLLSIERFSGGINIAALIRGKIDLYDVEFIRPSINLLTVNDSLSNYMIYSASSDTTSSESTMPKIAINRFSIVRPEPLRFSNLATDRHFSLALEAVSIESSRSPNYIFKIGGNLDYPELSVYNLNNMSFGLDGRIAWDPESPTEIEVSNFRLQSGPLDALVTAKADIGKEIIVKNYSFNLYSIPVESALDMMPDSLRLAYDLGPKTLSTDIAVSIGVKSTGPFNLTTDSIPNAEIEVEIIPGKLRYRQILLHNVSGKIFTYLRGNNIENASVVIENLNVAGPATDLLLNCKAFNLTTDPLVEGCLKGKTSLSKLPPQVTNLIGGYIKGNLTADIDFVGRASMIDPTKFHQLKIDGNVDISNLYYLSADTNNLITAGLAKLKFGTHTQVKADSTAKADSMLTALVTIDSARMLHTEYSMQLSDFRLGVGVLNQKESADTNLVLPMGGDLQIGKFYLMAIGDSIAFNVRKVHGHVTMRRFKGMKRVPEFLANLEIKRLSTGSPDTRFMLNNTTFNVTAHKLPKRRVPQHVRKAVDSIRHAYPDLPIDSVYKRAIEIHREKHRKHHPPRIHPEFTAEETEIIDWGTSNFIRRLLLEWDIKGSLSARRAGLFTPYFPVRNRMRHFNMEFNNDSINLTNVEFKAGSSDFLVSGVISNMKRGLTSKGFRSPLRLNFDLLSDTIDVNQLADATFRGSSYATTGESSTHLTLNLDSIEAIEAQSDADFERELGKIVVDAPEQMAPLMVPVNVDMRLNMKSKNIYYSDLALKNFTGEALVSQGGLNLNNLEAFSDMGSVGLSALYSSPRIDDIKFGFGLKVNDFNLHKFMTMVPAVDSIMPILRDVNGIINAQIAATCDIDSNMNIVLPSLEAAIRIDGDSLELIDKETYRTIGKWLLFRDKQDNIIQHMNVEVIVKDNMMTLYPFIFDIDRYKLGVQGHNDLNLNFDYHIAVLKSPIPFKFGINIKGDPEHYKIRLGKAHLNEKTAAQSVAIVDTTRVNLLAQIQNVFRRGVNNSKFAKLQISNRPTAASIDLNTDTISRADSLLFIQEGLIPAPLPAPEAEDKAVGKSRKRNKKNSGMFIPMLAILTTRPRKRK